MLRSTELLDVKAGNTLLPLLLLRVKVPGEVLAVPGSRSACRQLDVACLQCYFIQVQTAKHAEVRLEYIY